LTSERRYNLDLLRCGYRFQADPLPLAVVYLIGGKAEASTELGVEPVNAREALMSLVADTFATRLLDKPERAREFDVLARLVGSVPVRRLHNGGSLDRLSDLCRCVQSDVAQIPGTNRRRSSEIEFSTPSPNQVAIAPTALRPSSA
jgi:hypothetical protein